MEEEREIAVEESGQLTTIANNAVKKFKLEINCEDEHEMRHYLMANQYRDCLQEFDDLIRMLYKHGLPKDVDNVEDTIEFISDKFHNILDSNHVDLD